jgi:RNA ligase
MAFPIIHHINDVLPYIEGCKEFIVDERDDYTVINYLLTYSDTFDSDIKRECRGLIFDKSGNIISRPYHKFFNLGEKLDTKIENINFMNNHIILEKLDGSMVRPLLINDEFVLATKMGTTDVAKQADNFIQNKSNYYDFFVFCQINNLTPIFEWCSNQQKIVLDYEDQLILTAIRHLHGGEYVSYDKMKQYANEHELPVVGVLDKNVIDIKDDIDCEGIVVRFDNGNMIKVKTEWYTFRHNAKESVQYEKNILKMIFDNTIDDVVPFLSDEDANKILKYQTEVLHNIFVYVTHLEDDIVECLKWPNTNKRDFAINHAYKFNSFDKIIAFQYFDNKDIYNHAINQLTKYTNTATKIENIRHIIGVKYD